MNRLQNQASSIETSTINDDREEYTPPDIHDLGDVSSITKSNGCAPGGDLSYS